MTWGGPKGLDAWVVGMFPACWWAVTRVVVGLGAGLFAAWALLVMPWPMSVLLALTAVGLSAGAKVAGGWRHLVPRDLVPRELVPVDWATRWPVGLLTAAPFACAGWHVLLGGQGVAMVGADLLVGLPVLLRSIQRTEQPVGHGVPMWQPTVPGRLTLGADLVPKPRRRGSAPHGLDDLSPALGSASQPSPDEPRLLEQLSDAELRHAWQSSCRALLMVHDPVGTQRIVLARARYLDAMEQRDPDWFRNWALSSLSATAPLQDGSELDR
jgi:hypothetical protein